MVSFRAVGMDVHQKLVLTKMSNLILNSKRGKTQLSSFAPAQEVCVIDDDEESTSQAPTETLHGSTKSKRTTEKLHSSTKSKETDDSM